MILTSAELNIILEGYKVFRQKKSKMRLFTTTEIQEILDTYNKHLNDVFEPLKDEAIKINMESTLFNGAALHLSSSYREEHTSSWLSWILKMDIVPKKYRSKVFSFIFSELFPNENRNTFDYNNENIELKNEKFIEYYDQDEKKTVRGKLDVFIETQKLVIVIENKIGDMSLKKNIYYRKEIDSNYKSKKIFCILLIPEDYLKTFEDNDDIAQDEKKEIKKAFPPVTWEKMLLTFYQTIEHFQKEIEKERKFLYWKILVLAFISFIEGNVLSFNINYINEGLKKTKDKITKPEIKEIERYLHYRAYA